jgi:hypothetical protein
VSNARRRHALPVTLALAAVLGAAGCTSGNAGPSTTATRPDFGLPSTTPTTADPRASGVLDAYRAWWRTYVEVARSPNPDSPRLDDYASGDQLAADREDMGGYQRRGVVLRGNVQLHPEVTELAGGRAVVRDCVDGTQWVEVNKATGSTIPNTHREPVLYVATLRRVQGGTGRQVWKVAATEVTANRC